MVLCFWRVCANYLTRGFFLNLSDFVFLLMSSNFFSEKLDTTLPVSLRKGWEVWLLLFSHEVMSYSVLPHGLQNDRLPCPSLSPGVCAVMSIESMMPSNHLILCCPLLPLPSIFPSIRVFSNELALWIRWPKYWSFSISPSDEYSGLISFRTDWFDLLTVQGTLKSLL